MLLLYLFFFFFFNDPATPEISTLPLPDALPISRVLRAVSPRHRRGDRAAARPAPGAGGVRLPLDPLSRPTPVRWSSARVQPRQFLRRELRGLADAAHRAAV